MNLEFIKENINSIKEIADNSLVLGNPVKIGDREVLPLCKVKITYFILQTDLNEKLGNGSSANITITPVGFIDSNPNGPKLVQTDGLGEKIADKTANFFDSIISNLDVSSLFGLSKEDMDEKSS